MPKDLAQELAQRRRTHLYRQRQVITSPTGPEAVIDGRRYTLFCSNDYLALAAHPALVAAMQRGAEQWGVGAGAAHLVTGHMAPHHALEEELADFVGRPKALLFSTGYMANLGFVGALAGRGDAVFEDRLNHASLLDAARLAGARLSRYTHASASALEERLAASGAANKLVVTDGVFSMDGDLAPLPELARSAQAHDAWLCVDDAHGLGVIGAHGGGTLEHYGMTLAQVPVLMGTLGKGFGSFGAFIAGEADLIDYLIQSARPYIYTTALPPAVAEATRAALRISAAEPWRRTHLATLIARLRQGAEQLGLSLMASPSPIQPLLIGDPQRALTISQRLKERGFIVSAIRPPTVPPGTARLRITLTAGHREEQVDGLLEALAAALDQP